MLRRRGGPDATMRQYAIWFAPARRQVRTFAGPSPQAAAAAVRFLLRHERIIRWPKALDNGPAAGPRRAVCWRSVPNSSMAPVVEAYQGSARRLVPGRSEPLRPDRRCAALRQPVPILGAAGKKLPIVIAAIAREMAAFIQGYRPLGHADQAIVDATGSHHRATLCRRRPEHGRRRAGLRTAPFRPWASTLCT